MDREEDHARTIGAEATRRAAVLRPLVQDYLSGKGSLESGIRDAVWQLGVSRATVGRRADQCAGAAEAWPPYRRNSHI